MRRKTFITGLCILLSQAVILAACGSSKEGALNLPEREEVTSLALSDHDRNLEVTITDPQTIDSFFDIFRSQDKIIRGSYNESPNGEYPSLIRIDFGVSTNNGSEIYAYEYDGSFCMEQAYNGVFQMEESEYDKMCRFFLQGLAGQGQ